MIKYLVVGGKPKIFCLQKQFKDTAAALLNYVCKCIIYLSQKS